ncbi:hypothetical protein HF885_02290 [Olsenella umbonata]|uniref:Glycosyltransferase n=1 Tax=Parafannyhessea umbonata TaxID=604330 RepID=A0A7X9T9C9_9ACTN|nr:hypothetical protein [Parafannyhessea umbonata]NMF25277.1 hypothetical protein [Parafannyhessea umbonata]
MTTGTDRARSAFGNVQDEATYRKAVRSKEKFLRKFGDDSKAVYHLKGADVPVISETLGVRNLVLADGSDALDIRADAAAQPLPQKTERTVAAAGGSPVVVGNIRMGFGHYRISMAMASAAHAMGYTPYWLDLASFKESTGSKAIEYQNGLYSMGSRLSQRVGVFDKLFWEPLNSEGFRKLSYNSGDQKNAELCVPLFRDLPQDVPYIGTHVWPSQAAVHAGLTHVVNAIPDNWPMALHLAEGSIHTVQTPSAYLGYHQLRGMDPSRQLKPMPKGSLVYTGHYVDHELVSNIGRDCAARRKRVLGDGAVRYLISVGGAGAQQDLFASIIEHLIPYVRRSEATLFVNVGDHSDVWDGLVESVHGLSELAQTHFDDFSEVSSFASQALDGDVSGIHAFCDTDIFSAVYSSNVLMRCSDILVTKPSEFSFYPVPKLMIHRVGGHEAWGAIRAAEIGDGTYEMDDTDEVLSMIDSLQSDRDLISFMCDRIEQANAIGVYDGAYKVVELAVNGIE